MILLPQLSGEVNNTGVINEHYYHSISYYFEDRKVSSDYTKSSVRSVAITFSLYTLPDSKIPSNSGKM